jgi:hypothetical protein
LSPQNRPPARSQWSSESSIYDRSREFDEKDNKLRKTVEKLRGEAIYLPFNDQYQLGEEVMEANRVLMELEVRLGLPRN